MSNHIEPSIEELKVLLKINFSLRQNGYAGYTAKQQDTLINLVRREAIVRGFADELDAEQNYIKGRW